MKERIRNFLLNYINRRSLKKNVHQKMFLQKPVQDVVVLQRSSNPMPEKTVQLIADLFEMSIDRIRFLSVSEQEEDKGSPNHLYLQPDRVNYRGVLPLDVSRFCGFEVDVLINYFDDTDPLIYYLSLKFNAAFRLGFAPTDPRLNHIIFNFGLTNSATLAVELPKYLKPILASA